MAVVRRYIEILTVGVLFFRSHSILHSQDSFPLTFHPRLWETSSGVVAIGVFTAEARRELRARLSRLSLIYPGACLLLLCDWPALGHRAAIHMHHGI